MNNHHNNTSPATSKAGEASSKTMRLEHREAEQMKPVRASSNGRTAVSKTADRGSSPRALATTPSTSCCVVRVYLDGWRIGIAGQPGRKFTSVIVMDSSGLSVTRFEKAEAVKAIKPLDYPLSKAIKKMREAGKAFGITKSARKLLSDCSATIH